MKLFFVRFNNDKKDMHLVNEVNAKALSDQWGDNNDLQYTRLDMSDLTKEILVYIRRTSINRIEMFESDDNPKSN